MVAADLPGGLLIYAAGEGEDATHDVIHIGRQLMVEKMDLSGSMDQIMGRIKSIAEHVRSRRRQFDKTLACSLITCHWTLDFNHMLPLSPSSDPIPWRKRVLGSDTGHT